AFSSLVQAGVQASDGLAASPLLHSLASMCPLLDTLGVTGSSPVAPTRHKSFAERKLAYLPAVGSAAHQTSKPGKFPATMEVVRNASQNSPRPELPQAQLQPGPRDPQRQGSPARPLQLPREPRGVPAPGARVAGPTRQARQGARARARAALGQRA